MMNPNDAISEADLYRLDAGDVDPEDVVDDEDDLDEDDDLDDDEGTELDLSGR